jgi:tRNA modification GTPase
MSGPDCRAILERLVGPCPAARQAILRPIKAQNGEILDKGLVLWFPAPASYTGEDCAELHVHGGRAVMAAASRALMEAGARPAEPGEFTKRAFLNGKMDLLAAEGVADLVAADTEAQRQQALSMLGGAQSAIVADWADRLKRALAWQEALIDFSDEEVPASVEAALREDVQALTQAFSDAIGAAKRGARVRDGVVVAVTGPPNVGKSSLVNALAGRDAAITSPNAGTTRDVLEIWIDIAGHPVCLLDTAGLRDADDPVEAEGVRRAKARAARADLVIDVAACGAMGVRALSGDHLCVANKADLGRAPAGWIAVSAMTGEGMVDLVAALEERVIALTARGPDPALSRVRHEGALRDAMGCLERAMVVDLPELRAEELRLAMRSLGRITGSVSVEDILDTVFASFCIGK